MVGAETEGHDVSGAQSPPRKFTALATGPWGRRAPFLSPSWEAPQAERMAGCLPRVHSNPASWIREAQSAAGPLGQQLHLVNASSREEIEAAFATLAQLRAHALLVVGSALFTDQRLGKRLRFAPTHHLLEAESASTPDELRRPNRRRGRGFTLKVTTRIVRCGGRRRTRHSVRPI